MNMVREDREETVWFAVTPGFSNQIRLQIPERTHALVATPKPAHISSAYGKYSLTVEQVAGAVDLKEEMVLKRLDFIGAEHVGLRAFLERVQKARRQPIVLRRVTDE